MIGHRDIDHPRGPYPLFVPPNGLAEQTPRDWSVAQAKQYAAWLEAVLPDRVSSMATYFGLSPEWDESTLVALESLLKLELAQPPFSEAIDGRPTLTSSGYAVAADMGLLVAGLLLRSGLTSWEIVRRPKRDVNYHQPVLNGLRDHPPFNPIWAALSPANGIVQGRRWNGGWVRIYEAACASLGA
jgi:hypothetical protein